MQKKIYKIVINLLITAKWTLNTVTTSNDVQWVIPVFNFD